MKFCNTNSDAKRGAVSHGAGVRGFTLVEVMVTMFLLVILVTATLGSIASMQQSSTRVSYYNAAMAILEAKANDVRAVYYNPPNYPFTTGSTVTITNQYNVALNESATTFLIPGTLVTRIQYCGSMGHLVTITANFQASGLPLTASLQTFVNKYSGGQQ
jgi:prepilin-type N-terminal cleavage/methylation domain-containing protein